METQFKWVSSESVAPNADGAFGAICDLVRCTSLSATCYQARGGHVALIVTYRELCHAGLDHLSFDEAKGSHDALEASDGLLWLSSPEAIYGLTALLTLQLGDRAQVVKPKWLATPLEWRDDVTLALSEINQPGLTIAGILRLSTATDDSHHFELRLLDPIVIGAQLRMGMPMTKPPEGPGHLDRRAAWFQGRSSHKR